MYIKLNMSHKPYVPTSVVVNKYAPYCPVVKWLSMSTMVRNHMF